jgi:hypothetical protein
VAMTHRIEHVSLAHGREALEVRAGSVLSRLAVASSFVRAMTTGPENADGRKESVYPLTPLHWKVACTRRDELDDGVLAEHRDVVPEGTKIRGYAPKDLPNAGYNSVSFGDLVRPSGENVDDQSVPVVFWPYGPYLLAAEIPDQHLVAATAERFEWVSRFGRYGAFGAGMRDPSGAIFAVAARAIQSMPAAEVQPGVPAY